jgi:hypothetical protein
VNQQGLVFPVVVNVLCRALQELDELLELDPMARGIVLDAPKKRVATTVEDSPNMAAFVIVIEDGLVLSARHPTDGASPTLLFKEQLSGFLYLGGLELTNHPVFTGSGWVRRVSSWT